MLGALLILQAGTAAVLAPAPAQASATAPTIEIRARVRADSIRVEREGEASLTVHAQPLLAQKIEVDRSRPVPNATTVRNVEIVLGAAVTIDPAGRPATVSADAETTTGEPNR